MPYTTASVPQRGITISENNARTVVKQIIKQSFFPENAEIILQNDIQGAVKQTATSTDPDINLKYDDIVFLSFTERYSEESTLFDINRPMHQPLFKDESIAVSMMPIYTDVEVTMQLRFRTKDLTVLKDWQNRIRMRHGIQNLITYHELTYDYSIPHSLLSFIVDAYHLREKNAGYGIELGDYLKEHFVDGLTTRSNQSGSFKELVIVEKQSEIIGKAQDQQFYNEVETEEGVFEIPVSYRFDYRQLSGMRLFYPAMIHNSLIDQSYIRNWCYGGKDLLSENLQIPYGSLLKDREQLGIYHPEYEGTRFLPWDEWEPSYKPKDTRTLTIVPIMVNPQSPRLVLNLGEIAGDLLPQEAIDYLRENADLNAEYHKSLIGISLHEVSGVEHLNKVNIDSSLTVTSPYDLNLRLRYYLRVFIQLDLASGNMRSYARVNSNSEVALKLFQLIDPQVTLGKGNDPKVLNEIAGGITDASYIRWIKTLSYTHKSFLGFNKLSMQTVSSQTIKARSN